MKSVNTESTAIKQHRYLRLSVLLVMFIISLSGCSDQKTITVSLKNVSSFPKAIDNACRKGVAKIYDECGSQQNILHDALQVAKESNKTVLISYGAEWCIWCHVFDRYIKGYSRRFDYQWQYYDGENLSWTMIETIKNNTEADAQALNHYFAENFILAHIESFHAPDGEQVLIDLGYDVDSIVGVPLIITLDHVGQIAGKMKSTKELIGLEIRSDNGREFRGYDRKLLLTELKRLRKISSL